MIFPLKRESINGKLLHIVLELNHDYHADNLMTSCLIKYNMFVSSFPSSLCHLFLSMPFLMLSLGSSIGNI